jgi:hypothetical protein
MKPSKIIRAASLVILVAATTFCLRAAEKPNNEKEKIEALIKHLENLKDATFIRNDSDYTSKTAAQFLRRKWEAQEKEIKTATDFIDSNLLSR